MEPNAFGRVARWLTRLLLAAALLLASAPVHETGAAEGTPTPSTSSGQAPGEAAYPAVAMPAFLPYALGSALAVGSPAQVVVTIPPDELPANAVSWQLAVLFRYDPAAGRWQELPTSREQRGDDLLLTAETSGPATLAAALSTSTETGNYEQPWQPTVQDFQVDLFTGAATVRIPIDAPAGRGGLTPGLALSYNSGVVDALHGDVNPQASWAGLGWSLDVGYIARTIELDANYVPRCKDEYTLVLSGNRHRSGRAGHDHDLLPGRPADRAAAGGRGLPTDRRFTGQRNESALGSLYDYGARFYSSALGRFISADTIVPEPGNPQSLNRFSYALGNPLRYIDPTGHGSEGPLPPPEVCEHAPYAPGCSGPVPTGAEPTYDSESWNDFNFGRWLLSLIGIYDGIEFDSPFYRYNLTNMGVYSIIRL